jgi:DivIVA domain-containing protein
VSVYSEGMSDSFSHPDLTSPTSVAETSFPIALRGYRTEEVRLVLRDVAAEIARLQAQIAELTAARTDSDGSRRGPDGSLRMGDLDDETVRQVLGEEMVKVLQTAREAAAEIVERGERNAAQLIREASTQAAAMRHEAELDVAKMRADASAQAQAEVDQAREQGREMVAEAQAYRERLMTEITRRRDAARLQIDQLLQGRETMVQVFERAQRVVREVLGDLGGSATTEAFVDLRADDSEPVPVISPSLPTPPQETPILEDEVAPEQVVPEQVAPEQVAPEQVVPESVDIEPDEARSNVVDLFPTHGADGSGVEGLFAKLRAETAEALSSAMSSSSATVVEPAAPTETTQPVATSWQPSIDDSVFGQREAAVVPLIVAAARRIKRILADEQNEVLGLMRSSTEITSVEDLVADAPAHAMRYVQAMMDELLMAHGAGAAISGSSVPELGTADLARITGFVADGLVEPLRSRLDRAVLHGGGDIDDTIRRVRAVYREWKTQHIDQHLEDVMRMSFGLGVLAGVPTGAKMCWKVDPRGRHCPDAEDNSLAGAVAAGDPYPTGHTFAPAYAGCRCLVLPAAEITESS